MRSRGSRGDDAIMFWVLVIICEALFWSLLAGFAFARYWYGRRRLSLFFLGGVLVNEVWLIPFAIRDITAFGRFSILHADVILEPVVLLVVFLLTGSDFFRKVDRGAEGYVARVRKITESEGHALPRAAIFALRSSRREHTGKQDATDPVKNEEAPDLEHARRQRRGWLMHLAVFVVVQVLIQLALIYGLLEPSDGLFFGNGPKSPVGIGPIEFMPDVGGLRRVWLVILVVDFLWSFSYTLWPKQRSAQHNTGKRVR